MCPLSPGSSALRHAGRKIQAKIAADYRRARPNHRFCSAYRLPAAPDYSSCGRQRSRGKICQTHCDERERRNPHHRSKNDDARWNFQDYARIVRSKFDPWGHHPFLVILSRIGYSTVPCILWIVPCCFPDPVTPARAAMSLSHPDVWRRMASLPTLIV